MPTEAELVRKYRVSRHTVRQAFHDLVAEGLVRRAPGRGTFVTGLSRRGKYLRSTGNIEDLMSWPGTEMEVLKKVSIVEDQVAASHLGQPAAQVATLLVRRLYEGLPFVVTRVHLPPEPGRWMMREGLPAENSSTVLEVLEQALSTPIAGVSQSITAEKIPEDFARYIDYKPGEPALRVERTYFDADGHPVEYAVSFYNPNRYAYRLELRRRMEG